MTKQVATVAMTMLLSVAGARADSIWSFESTSPLWACAIECSPAADDEIVACLEACGRYYDANPSPRTSADELRCKASLMRAEAAQFSCHSHCLSAGDTSEADIPSCVDACNTRYQAKTALILATSRCASMRDQ